MDKVSPFLWFGGQAEEAAHFYVSLLPDSRIDAVNRAPMDYPAGKAGDVLTVEFTLGGRSFVAMNGGSDVRFNDAVSLQIECEDQAEVDFLWDALAEGGEPVACGWIRDRFGLSWQVTPRRLRELISGPGEAAGRAMAAMMQMVKIDIAALEAAAA